MGFASWVTPVAREKMKLASLIPCKESLSQNVASPEKEKRRRAAHRAKKKVNAWEELMRGENAGEGRERD